MDAIAVSERLQDVISSTCENCLEGMSLQSRRISLAYLFSAIKYLEDYYFCRECSAFYCATCQLGHLFDHGSKLLRFVDVSWSLKMQGIRIQSDCSRCTRVAKCRLECLDCLSSICHSCIQQHDQGLTEHGSKFPSHKSFRFILPPYWLQEPVTDSHCPCFNVHGIVSHCDRCHKGYTTLPNKENISLTSFNIVNRIEDVIYLCKTYQRESGASFELCSNCISGENPEHLSTHTFFCIALERAAELPDNLQDQIRYLWRCRECSFLGGPEFPYSHDHLKLSMRIGDALMDDLRSRVPARCVKNKSQIRRIPNPPNPTASKCLICTKLVALDVWNKLCMRCDSFVCRACVDAQRVVHRHTLHWIRVVKVTVQALLAGGAGRNCDICGKKYYGASFTGMTCTVCWNFDCYLVNCLTAQKRLPLEHMHCKGQLSAWQLSFV